MLSKDTDDILSLAALLSTQIDRRHGEIVLNLGPHNLSEPSLSSLFDSAEGTSSLTAPFQTTIEDRNAFLDTLDQAANEINCDLKLLWDSQHPTSCLTFNHTEQSLNDSTTTARWTPSGLMILIRRRVHSAEDISELRVAVVGNVDAGKSTLLGVLTKGRLDDGRGRARVALFRLVLTSFALWNILTWTK